MVTLLTEAQVAILRDLNGACENGYTDDDVYRVSDQLEEAIGYRAVVAWNFFDMWGFGGDSEMFLYKRRGRATAHYLFPESLWTLLYERNPSGDARVSLRHCQVSCPRHATPPRNEG